jgi:hypothetical protein
MIRDWRLAYKPVDFSPQQQAPLFGQLDRAPAPAHQLHFQLTLQRPHLLPDRRCRQAKRPRRPREIPFGRRQAKTAQLGELELLVARV